MDKDKTPYINYRRLVRFETEVYLQSSGEGNTTECMFVCVREREDWKGTELNDTFPFSFFHIHGNGEAQDFHVLFVKCFPPPY